MFIEKNDLEAVKKKLLNPRYLISSGDSPVIIKVSARIFLVKIKLLMIVLKESCRYNSLHICAIYNHYEICEFILKTLSDVNFIRLLYVSDTIEQTNLRVQRLLDLYLNMPEKGVNQKGGKIVFLINKIFIIFL
jgi:hypothetical protein